MLTMRSERKEATVSLSRDHSGNMDAVQADRLSRLEGSRGTGRGIRTLEWFRSEPSRPC